MSSEEKISCAICGAQTHIIKTHLQNDHPEVTLEEYRRLYPDAPVVSQYALKLAEERRAKKDAESKVAPATAVATEHKLVKKPMNDLFKLGSAKAALNAMGEPIMVTVLPRDEAFADLIPDTDPEYVWDIDGLKTCLMGLELNIPTYLWGHAGTGKSTRWEQVCAYTNRPYMRVQHTANTEESHILGQWVVKDGHTVFELGPLAVAMKYGLVYCADEYDFALPQVLSVYQPVLEGKPLVIKEADHANRVIKPHPHFRFVATGNTNGVGDETGLYQGTNIQNAANYERFGIVDEVGYMSKKQETLVIQGQVADCPKEVADKLTDFAAEIRKMYVGGKIGMTISPRVLINAATVGIRRADMKLGIQLAFSNRLTRVDKETVDQYAQRIFG